jgi:hypothetical protein
LQSADENSASGQIFNGLDKLVDATVTFFSAIFTVKSFTKSWLTSGFMIAYVYLGCLLILFLRLHVGARNRGAARAAFPARRVAEHPCDANRRTPRGQRGRHVRTEWAAKACRRACLASRASGGTDFYSHQRHCL